MSSTYGTAGQEARSEAASSTAGTPDRASMVRAGLIGGLAGGIIIWIYEALVWVGVQHLMPLAGIPRNATGLVFGKQVQEQLGTAAYFVGTGIHFLFALAWGVLFAFLLHCAARVDRQTASCTGCNRLTRHRPRHAHRCGLAAMGRLAESKRAR